MAPGSLRSTTKTRKSASKFTAIFLAFAESNTENQGASFMQQRVTKGAHDPGFARLRPPGPFWATSLDMSSITYRIAPDVTDSELNQLFASAWTNHADRKFESELSHSLTYICAYDGPRIVGFANVAWDGGLHAFLLDVTVQADYQRRGIGHELVARVKEIGTQHHIEWLHVDYEPQLEPFYRACGFQETKAGVLNLSAVS